MSWRKKCYIYRHLNITLNQVGGSSVLNSLTFKMTSIKSLFIDDNSLTSFVLSGPSAVLPKVTDESQTTGFSPPEWNKSAVLSADLTIHEFPIGQRVCCFGHVLACSDVCLFISFVVLAMFRPVLMPVFSHEFKEHMCQQRW